MNDLWGWIELSGITFALIGGLYGVIRYIVIWNRHWKKPRYKP